MRTPDDETAPRPAEPRPAGRRSEPQPLGRIQGKWRGPFAQGELVGESYEITGVLGFGGMGVVYEAKDLELRRAVAIKVALQPSHAVALRNEAQAMAQVQHPNLVTIHALRRHGPVDYLVMERVIGMTLEQRVSEAWQTSRPIRVIEVLDILGAITAAVCAVHAAGVAHRDIKAANVILSSSRVVLTDFGLVMPEVAVRPDNPVAGSIDYMSPELILGRVRSGMGPSVDLYALGVVAFEALAAKRPYAAGSLQAIMAGHLTKPVPDVRTLRPETPPELADLVRELMAKDPAERPDSSEAVLWRLTSIRTMVAALPEPQPLTVLVICQDDLEGEALRHDLRWSLPRLTVEVVTEVRSAVERLERQAPDILVMDLDMPNAAVELCMAVLGLATPVDMTVVGVSANPQPPDLEVLQAIGMGEVVPKGTLATRLCAVISEMRRSRTPLSRAGNGRSTNGRITNTASTGRTTRPRAAIEARPGGLTAAEAPAWMRVR